MKQTKTRAALICAVAGAIVIPLWFLVISRALFLIASAEWGENVAITFAVIACILSIVGFIAGATIGSEVGAEMASEERAKKEAKGG
jgi:hypothetical protein